MIVHALLYSDNPAGDTLLDVFVSADAAKTHIETELAKLRDRIVGWDEEAVGKETGWRGIALNGGAYTIVPCEVKE